MNLPQIFDSRAQFVDPVDVSGLDAATLERLNGVRTAYRNLQKAEADERAAAEAISAGIEAVADAKKYRADNYPPSTPHDEWVNNFGNAEQRRALAQRQRARR
jgi:cytosine/adenosine deaminase-related metal-dependent hydrolase